MELLEQYLEGHRILQEAIQGLTAEQMKTVPADGGWSIHQIVIHVVDAETVYTGRIKQTLAEEMPPLLPYDQDKWAERLYYHEADVTLYLELFRLLRKTNAQLLRKATEEEWERKGRHAEAGELTVRQMLKALMGHVTAHVNRIQKIREELFMIKTSKA